MDDIVDYRDGFGRPMLRMTFDYNDNEYKLANHFADLSVKIGEAMGAGKVVRACAFPQNAGKNPTGAVAATTLWAAEAIKNRYLKAPGALA